MSSSVVIPCYNKADLVGDALESVMGQTFAPHEVIVVDDGSTDGSSDLISKHFPSVHVIRQSNLGVSAARNRGALAARAAWVSFLDADDVWLRNHIAETRRIIEAFPQAGLVSSAHRQVRGSLLEGPPEILCTTAPRLINYLKESVVNWGAVCSSSASVRRNVFVRVGGFGPFTTGEDIDLWTRISLSETVAVSDTITVLYRRGVGGVSESLNGSETSFPPPNSLHDLQPCCRSLLRELGTFRSGDDPAAADIKSFLAFLAEMFARQAFVRGDFPAFVQIYSLRPEGAPKHSFGLAALASAPPLGVSIAHFLYRLSRRFRRIFRVPRTLSIRANTRVR